MKIEQESENGSLIVGRRTEIVEIGEGVFFSTHDSSEAMNFSPKRVLLIGAHPDDIELGCAGTVVKFQNTYSCETHMVVVTDGAKGSWTNEVSPDELRATRSDEQKKAADILRVDSLTMLQMSEGTLAEHLTQLNYELVRIIRKVRPDLVITHDPTKLYDFNPDHRTVAQHAAEAAAIRSANYGYWPELSTEGYPPHFVPFILFFNTDHPNLVVSIDEPSISLKERSIAAHNSQFGDRSDEINRQRNTWIQNGQIIHAPFAEIFHLEINR